MIMRRKNRINALVKLGLALAIALTATGHLRAEDNSILGKVKRLFTGTPTPTPVPKKKKRSTTKKSSPSSTSRSSSSPHPKSSASPHAARTPEPTPSKSAEESATSSTTEEAPEIAVTPPEATPESTRESSPSETPQEPESTPSPLPSVTPSPRIAASPKSTPRSKSPVPSGTAPVSVSSSEIAGYDKNPPAVRNVLDAALELTTRNLGYKYGSADPANGGMDCSGFIYYVLRQAGMKDVPRDAREQYIWVRKARKFQAVLGHSADTFELDDLKPGDLLFWAGTYNIDRDPGITHTMIYLGREKSTNQRVMVGSSDGRTYKGQSRFGVGVFDFKIAGRKSSSANEPGPVFVGYASIPGLEKETRSGDQEASNH